MKFLGSTSILFLALLLAACASVVAGCSADPAHGDDHDHDDHLEHHVPEHKPPDLESAAREIPRRWVELESGQSAADAHERGEQLHELLDIVRWLPEVAGDSDLPEGPWNRVNAISRELLARLQTDGPLPALAASQPLLEELRQLAEQQAAEERAISQASAATHVGNEPELMQNHGAQP
jgi:hypothetical protein